MRDSYGNKRQLNPVILLIVVNLALFIVQNLPKMFRSEFPLEWFAVTDLTIFGGRVWTFFTYCFFHDINNLGHIFFNMLMLFFVGNSTVHMLGDKRFYYLYFSGAIGGAIAWMCIQNYDSPYTPTLIGASAACYALIIFTCVVRANERVMLLFPPIELKPKWLGWFIFGLQVFLFLTDELPGHGGRVAHSAHLGGMLIGYLWARSYMGKTTPFRVPFAPGGISIEKPKWMSKKSKIVQNFKVNISMDRVKLQKEVDRILDKINDKGFGSLTEEEKNILDQAKDILGK
jgi:membrane associated rhomboid family serine protease